VDKFKKIVSKDKSIISLDKVSGQIWASNDNERSFFSCGTVVNGACNVHKICSIPDKYKDYFPVSTKLLRFAERFGIRKLRLISHDSKLVKYGWKICQSYGYVSSSRFDSLLRKRKQIEVHSHKIILLKRSDAKWKDE